LRLNGIFAKFKTGRDSNNECPVGMLYMPRPAIGGVGLAYRAWTSVVFLPVKGLRSPHWAWRTGGLHAFLCVYAYAL